MIDPAHLVDDVLRGVLGGRRKKSKKALRYLTGRKQDWLRNPQTLLTAAGVVWGVIETLQNQGSGGSAAATPAASPATVLPPLPNVAQASAAPPQTDAMRIAHLAISAAYADGAVGDAERTAIAQHVPGEVAAELSHPRPLAEIVAGVTDPAQRATLYVLAFTVLRADEQVSGAERIYLAQLAHLLGLNPEQVRRLEDETSRRIDGQDSQ